MRVTGANCALLARIDDVNGEVNAVVELRREAALREAAAADSTRSGVERGPLHGVPITVKEALDVAELHTTWGNPAFREWVAERDATVVRRLRQAGAIIVGKTNVHTMLSDFGQTSNELYGTTNNPWDTARTPGGSGGGGAAALAAALTFLDYGSDLVGSIRIPASFCGVYGLRPSVGIVPLSGFQVPGTPAAPPEITYMSAIGPLARTAEDLRTALKVTAGPEPPTSQAYSWRLAPPRHTRLKDFRVGVVLGDERAPLASDVAGVLNDTLETLRREGIQITEGWPEAIDPRFWISHASLAGLPAVVAPVGRTRAGLPVGLQIVGPMYEDDTALTFAQRLAELVGGYERPPEPFGGSGVAGGISRRPTRQSP